MKKQHVEPLIGSVVTLKPIEVGDTDLIIRWRNMPHVKANLFTQDDLTVEQHLLWMKKKVFPGHCHQFVIFYNAKKAPIGTVFLKNINCIGQSAEFGIFIGEKDFLGNGAGSESTRLVIEYGFKVLGLDEIYLYVLSNNIGAMRSYERNGFVIDNSKKEQHIRNGMIFDVITMRINRRDPQV